MIVPSVPSPASDCLAVRDYLQSALASSTVKAYQTDLAHYRAYGGMVPADPQMVADYLSAHASVLSMATLSRRIVSISRAHTLSGHADPTKTDLVQLTMRGIRRVHGKPQRQVAPLLKDDILLMVANAPTTLKGRRDKALLLLGFCAALRRSELVAVKIEDLEFTALGLILTLPRSKTDQYGLGRKIAVPHGRGRICPVKAVNEWIAHSGATAGFVFRSITKAGVLSSSALSDRAVSNIIKQHAKSANLDPANYSGHSLRSGLCTSAAQHGVPSWKIRRQTGHKSDSVLARYIRDGDLFTGNAADLF